MIVEISGAPGSGKTTLLHKVKELIEPCSGVEIIDWNNNKSFLDLRFFIGGFFLLKREDWNIVKTCNYIMQHFTKIPFLHRLNILRNCVKKLSVIRTSKNDDKVILIDEGSWHIPYSIFVDGMSENVDYSQLETFLHLLPKIDFLVVVKNEDVDELVDRILKRGNHRRIGSFPYRVKNFIIQSLKVQNVICNFWKRKNWKIVEIFNTYSIEDLEVKKLSDLIENHKREGNKC